jgi:very-short-patch-repair endonuclease
MAVPSPIEEVFAKVLFQKALGLGIKRNYYIDKKYRVDFVHLETMIIIELDGFDSHSGTDSIRSDRIRERVLEEELGYHVIRFSGKEIYENTEELVDLVIRKIRSKQREMVRKQMKKLNPAPVSNIITKPFDRKTSLWSLVEDYRREKLRLPPHQRGIVWSRHAKESWIRLIIKHSTNPNSNVLPCMVVTYQLTSGGYTFINDGGNRIGVSNYFYENAGKYGYSREEVEDMLRNFTVSHYHLLYDTEREAALDFNHINMGTKLTAREMYKWVLLYSEHDWLPVVEELNKFMLEMARKYHFPVIQSKKTNHIYERHNLALFYRYLKGEKRLKSDYASVTSSNSDMIIIDNEITIEQKLVKLMETMGLFAVEEKLTEFFKFVDSELEQITSLFYASKQSVKQINNSFVRYLLQLSIWRLYNHLGEETHKRFLSEMFAYSDGTSAVQKGFSRITVGINRENVKLVANLIGFEPYKKLE